MGHLLFFFLVSIGSFLVLSYKLWKEEGVVFCRQKKERMCGGLGLYVFFGLYGKQETKLLLKMGCCLSRN